MLRFRARDGRPLGRVLDPGAALDWAVALSPDGATVAVRRGRRHREPVGPSHRHAAVGPAHRPRPATDQRSAWSPTGSVLATVSGFEPRRRAVGCLRPPCIRGSNDRLVIGDAAAHSVPQPHVQPRRSGRRRQRLPPARGRVTFVDVARRSRVRRPVRLGGSDRRPSCTAPTARPSPPCATRKGRCWSSTPRPARSGPTRQVGHWPVGWAFVHGGRRIAIRERARTASQLGRSHHARALGRDHAGTVRRTRRDRRPQPRWLERREPRRHEARHRQQRRSAPSSGTSNPRHWEKLACRIAGRNLTRAEWNQYLPGRDYHRTCPA